MRHSRRGTPVERLKIEASADVGVRAGAPYPPSVVDRFMAWVDGLPGPVWAAYVVLLLVLILIVNGVAWLDGSTPVGTFDLYRTSVPFYPVAVLALMHYFNRVAHRALAAFRPALGASEADYDRLAYELTTLPWGPTWGVLGLSLVFTAAFTLLTPDPARAFSRSSLLAGVDLAIYVIVFGLIAVFVFHTLQQLRMVSRIHASASNVNLFQLTPLYAFSVLTAQTGLSLLVLNYFSVVTDPATFVNPALFGLTIFATVGAIVCFVLPLKGMHDRIAAEKNRLRAEANSRLEAAIQQLYRRVDTGELTGIDQLHQLMASLVTTRDVLAKIPTWPWETGTLTGFLTALLLPLAPGLLRIIIPVVEPLL